MIILVLLIVTALAFDFTNGFHDTGTAMATSIATGAPNPKTAVQENSGRTQSFKYGMVFLAYSY